VENRATEPEIRTVYCDVEENIYAQIIRTVICGASDINLGEKIEKKSTPNSVKQTHLMLRTHCVITNYVTTGVMWGENGSDTTVDYGTVSKMSAKLKSDKHRSRQNRKQHE
jgi:hypothetical protein